MDFIFFGLTVSTLFVFRRRAEVSRTRTPGHPWTTIMFVAICWLVVANTIFRYPSNTLIGMSILLAGVPAYFLWNLPKRARA